MFKTAEAFVEMVDRSETTPVSPVHTTLASEKAFVIPATDDRLQAN